MYESLGATLHAMNQMQKRCPKCKKGRTCRVRINEKGFALFCSSCGYQAQAEDGTLIGAVRKATGTLPEAGYGESSPVSFAKLSQDGLWLKMCSSCYQTLLIENTGGGIRSCFARLGRNGVSCWMVLLRRFGCWRRPRKKESRDCGLHLWQATELRGQKTRG